MTIGKLIATLADATTLGATDVCTGQFPYGTDGRRGEDIAAKLGVTESRPGHNRALRAAYQAGREHAHCERAN